MSGYDENTMINVLIIKKKINQEFYTPSWQVNVTSKQEIKTFIQKPPRYNNPLQS